MKRKCLEIGIILLFVGVTIVPTINFNTVKASQQNIIKERINQKELLFQTIVDIANNMEIQRIILKSQMSRGIFPTSEFPVVTKNQIRQMYLIGLILSKFISKSRIQSMIGEYQFNNQEIQKEISIVIEKNSIFNAELTQLSSFDCDCENHDSAVWRFPIICSILGYLFFGIAGISIVFLPEELFKVIIVPILSIIIMIAVILHCIWVDYYLPYVY
jgi:hypothetical protein